MKKKILKSTSSKKNFKERIPAELKSKTGRLNFIRAKLNDGGSKEDHIKEAKALSRRLKNDVWNWTTNAERAAYLIAENRMGLAQIGQKTGFTEKRLKKMLTLRGEFSERVELYRKEWIEHLKRVSIANRDVRISILADLEDKLLDIVKARRNKYAKRAHPGASTGYMVRTVKAVGHGRQAKIVRGWDVDKDLIREIKDTMVQMAKERGEWSEKVENSNTVLVREYSGVNTADV